MANQTSGTRETGLRFVQTSPVNGQPVETDDAVELRKQLAAFLGPFEGLRWVFVIGANGEWVGADGTSRSLSTPEDFELLMAARGLSGAAITSAKTAAAEQLNQSALTSLLVVYGEGDPGGFPALEQTEPSKRPVHILRNQGRWLSPTVILNAAEQIAKASGRQGLLLESGPTLARAFIQAGNLTQLVVSQLDGVDANQAKVTLETSLGLASDQLQLQASAQLGERHTVSIWKIAYQR